MNMINKSRWFFPVMCFSISLICAAPCLAQNAPSELSAKDQFKKQLSVRIKQQRVKGKELKKLGLIDDEEVVDIDYEGFTYVLDFRNGSSVSFDDLKVECRFFYTEEKSGASGPMNSDTSLGNPVVKYQEEEMTCSVNGNGRYNIETRPFIIKSWLLPGGWYFSSGTPNKQECDEEGLWVRVTYTTPDGEELQRDFYDSKSLSSKVTWDGKSI